jgi:hypothetical protein
MSMGTIGMPSAGVLDPTRGGEHIDRLIRGRSITELPTHRAILEKHHQDIAAIDGQPLIEPEKARQRQLVRERTREALEQDLTLTIKARSREFDQLEGQAIAAARRDAELTVTDAQFRRAQALTSEWNLILSAVPHESDINRLALLAEDAALAQHPGVYRAAMQAITLQSGRLAAIERKRTADGSAGPAQIAHATLEGEFSQWRKAHPTPAELKRQAAEARARMEMELQQSAQLYRQFFGL